MRDSNPRYPKGVYRISSPAHSVTLPIFPLQRFFFADAKITFIIEKRKLDEVYFKLRINNLPFLILNLLFYGHCQSYCI